MIIIYMALLHLVLTTDAHHLTQYYKLYIVTFVFFLTTKY